jgi:iron(III) transport system ATP-binding protein
MAGLTIHELTRRFGDVAALQSVSFSVADGAFLALLGPSGCGKTTLLRLIAGFDRPDAGEIRLGEEIASRPGHVLAPELRGIGMVFQNYALWPNMDVAGNVGFALKVRRLPAQERARRVAEALENVGLGGYEKRRTSELSGGQRQRVALARCLAMQPRMVLLDEPLANLDAHLRETMQTEFRRLHRKAGTTFVYVTHDQGEAMALADSIAVMDRGRVAQIASPQDLYREPASTMVARFIGRGHVIDGRIVGSDGDGSTVEALGIRFRARGRAPAGTSARICLRPADLAIETAGSTSGFAGAVVAVRYQGARNLVQMMPDRASGGEMLTVEYAGNAISPGDRIAVGIKDAWILPQDDDDTSPTSE